MATLIQQANSLITQYIKNYKEQYNIPPKINRFREKWGFQSMIEDYGYERAKLIIDYYFQTKRQGHPVTWLLYNYDELDAALTDSIEDQDHLAQLRAQTKLRVEEYERSLARKAEELNEQRNQTD